MFVFDTCFVSLVFLMDSWPCGVMVHKRKIVNLISPCRGTQDRARQSGAQTRLEAPHWLMRMPCRYRGRPPLQNASASNSMTEVAQLLGWCLQFAKHGVEYPRMLILHKLSVCGLAGKMAVPCLMLFVLRVSWKIVCTSQSAVSPTQTSEAAKRCVKRCSCNALPMTQCSFPQSQ